MEQINPLYPITELTQAQYDSLGVKDANTLYAIPLDGVPPSHQRPAPGRTLPCVLITQADYDALGTYDGNTLYCIWHLGPVYDETKIAVILLDENDEPTDQITYFYTIRSAQSYLYSADSSNRYLLYIGKNAGITEISQNSLSNLSTLRRVRIPDSVLSLGLGAFQDSANLARIDGMGNVSSIENYAFNGCASLKNIDLPGTLVTVGRSVFMNSGLESIVIPDSVTSELISICEDCASLISATIGKNVSKISTNAFRNCTRLSAVTIKNGVQEMLGDPFYSCTSLTEILIPNSVTAMQTAFTDCTNLATIVVDAAWGHILPTYLYPPATTYCWGAPNATIIWTRGYPAIKIMNGSSVVKYTDNIEEASNFVHNGYSGDEYYVEISGNTITSVGGFANSQYLYGISMNANSITTIADGAFSNCINLSTVKLSDSITYIGNGAFANCSALSDINIPDAPLTIATYAFTQCTSLTNIFIPSSVVDLASSTFNGCTKITKITIDKPENSISDAPWGAPNATVVWTG